MYTASWRDVVRNDLFGASPSRRDRPYRGGRRAPDALAEIKRCSATQFDPEVVAALDAVARDGGAES